MWYLAKIVFQIVSGEGNHSAQFDEQLRLINAVDNNEAFQKAQILGRREEDIFFNANNELVKWQYINVSELNELAELADGVELYSRIEEKENAEGYLHTISQKAAYIRSGYVPAMLM